MEFSFSNGKTATVPLENIVRSQSQFLLQTVKTLQEEKEPLTFSLAQFPLVHALHCVAFLQQFVASVPAQLELKSTRMCHVVDAKCAAWFNAIVYDVLKGQVPELVAWNNVADQLGLQGLVDLICLKVGMAQLELRLAPEPIHLLLRGIVALPPEPKDAQIELAELRIGSNGAGP
jgi:hypothetical protein